MKYLFILPLLLMLSCTKGAHPDVSDQTLIKLDNLVGKHKSEVVLEYGNPEKKEPFEGGDGEIWSYYFDLARGPVKTMNATVPAHSSTVQLMFIIDKADNVRKWITRRQEHSTNSTVIY